MAVRTTLVPVVVSIDVEISMVLLLMHRLHRLLAAAVNTAYSFWWDVTNDWGFELLVLPSQEEKKCRAASLRPLVLPSHHCGSPSASGSSVHLSFTKRRSFEGMDHSLDCTSISQQSHPYGLRPILLFPLPIYPLLIFLDLSLRLTWSIRLSNHIHSVSYGSVAVLFLEIAELLRRWMWTFLRIEWEAVKKSMAEGLKPVKVLDDGGSCESLGLDGDEELDAGESDVIYKGKL
jgi:hypothetical protein